MQQRRMQAAVWGHVARSAPSRSAQPPRTGAARGRARWRPGSRRSARACCCSTCCWASSWACMRRTSTACSSGARPDSTACSSGARRDSTACSSGARGACAGAPAPGRGCGLCHFRVPRLQHGAGVICSAGCAVRHASSRMPAQALCVPFCMQRGRQQAPKLSWGCTKMRHSPGKRLGRRP